MKKIFLAFIAAALLCACSDDNSVSAPEDYGNKNSSTKRETVSSIYELGSCSSDNRGESIYVTNQSTYYTCVGGNWISENSSQNQSSNNQSNQPNKPVETTPVQSIYTTFPVEIAITLTNYKQLKTMDMANNQDGDPRIHFIVKTYNDDIRRDSLKTEVINLGNDIGSWSGSIKKTLNLSKNIDRITICPKFVDEDVLFNDTEYNTGNCFNIDKVGQKLGKIKTIEDAGMYYTLEFTVVFK